MRVAVHVAVPVVEVIAAVKDGIQMELAVERGFAAKTWAPVRLLSFRQTKVHEYATGCCRPVEEVCWFDVSVNDASSMNGGKSTEKTSHVQPHVRDTHFAVVVSEVGMRKIRKYCYHLVVVAEGGDERAD